MRTVDTVILILLGVLAILFIAFAWECLRPPRWINKKTTQYPESGELNPTDRYKRLVKRYGSPDVIDKNPGGVAVWKRETLKKRGAPWFRIEIRDQQIPHMKPAPHWDFLYLWYPLHVPEDKLMQVLGISKSITYDPLMQMIRARCHFMGANIATLWLVKKVVRGEMKGTPDEYKAAIMSTMPTAPVYDPRAEARMVAYLVAS
jgi:hypothetical protein